VRVPAGSRVIDVLAAAGGPAPDAALDLLNLAAPAVDGSRVYVPRAGEEPPAPIVVDAPATTPGSGGVTDGGLVDLNAADEAALDALPGVGPVTAAAIIAHREANGPFRAVEDLMEVRGIGPAKFDALAPMVTVSG
jgi:competence protein ComEA